MNKFRNHSKLLRSLKKRDLGYIFSLVIILLPPEGIARSTSVQSQKLTTLGVVWCPYQASRTGRSVQGVASRGRTIRTTVAPRNSPRRDRRADLTPPSPGRTCPGKPARTRRGTLRKTRRQLPGSNPSTNSTRTRGVNLCETFSLGLGNITLICNSS